MEVLMNDRLLNVDEVKDYLNISKAAVYQYAKSKTMPSTKNTCGRAAGVFCWR